MRLAGILQEQHGYKEKSCLVRAYTGKRIFQNKMQHDALRLIIKASHVEKETRDEAAQRLAAESDS
jgi:hypothetical protein